MDGGVNLSNTNWIDVFIASLNDHVPKNKARNVNDHPWIDTEFLDLLKRKNKARNIATQTGKITDLNKFKQLRRDSKVTMINKRDNFVQNLKASMHENPSKFWSFVKTSTHHRSNANFLRNGN